MSWRPKFTVGDHVVFVGGFPDPKAGENFSELPVFGRMYVVRELFASFPDGEISVRLVGIWGASHPAGEFGFMASAFCLPEMRSQYKDPAHDK